MSRFKVKEVKALECTWDDKRIEDLSREELIEAVKVLGQSKTYWYGAPIPCRDNPVPIVLYDNIGIKVGG